MKGPSGRRALRLTLAVLAGLFVVGCSTDIGAISPTPRSGVVPSPSRGLPVTSIPVPTPNTLVRGAPEQAWTEYEEPADGFAVSLPAGWQKVVSGSQMVAIALETLERCDRGLAALLSQNRTRLANSEIPFLAVDRGSGSGAGGFTASLNVLHRRLSGPISLAEYSAANVRTLENTGPVVKPVEQEILQLPAGGAVRLRYQLSVKAREGGEFSLSLTQFLLVRGQEGFVLTFATAPAELGRYQPVFDRIGRSFRWLPGGQP